MIIHLYAICWNEEKILPFFLRYYTPLVDRMFIADNGSTDRSVEILRGCPKVALSEFETVGDSVVLAMQQESNEVWKQSRGEADWVIIADIDELMYHPDLRGYLEQATRDGITMIRTKGWQMVADRFPEPDENLPQTIRHGLAWEVMDKPVIFNPNAIEETHFAEGRHTANPTGRVVYPGTSEVRLLHYKYLGTEYLIERHGELLSRRRRIDLERRYGYQYYRTPEENIADFQRVKNGAVEVVSVPVS